MRHNSSLPVPSNAVPGKKWEGRTSIQGMCAALSPTDDADKGLPIAAPPLGAERSRTRILRKSTSVAKCATVCATVAQRSAKQHVTLRLQSTLKEALNRQATKEGLSQTGLAERYLEEAVRVAEHPGIVFRGGPAGRRAAVVGGPDVWEIVGTFLAEKRNASAVARYLNLPNGLVRAALDYYADHMDEIDVWVLRNQLLADESEAAAHRRRRVAGG